MAINTPILLQEVGYFFELFEDFCTEEYCGLLLKKLDKKKERYVTVVQMCMKYE